MPVHAFEDLLQDKVIILLKQLSHNRFCTVSLVYKAGGVAKLCYCSLSRDNTGASKSI